MSVMPEPVVIVGASLAGIRTAAALRRAKFDGPVTIVGAEPHLPYDRPPLSKQLLLGQWEPERLALTNPEELTKIDVTVRTGSRATGVDTARKRLLIGREELPYGNLVIATGTTPRTLPGTPALKGIHTLRTLDDALAIRAAMEAGARVAVVGAGFIGAEVAAAARIRGLEATMIEALSQPLERALGPEIGAVAARLHREHGVQLHLGASVEGFEGSSSVEGVRLGGGTVVPADLVVVGIGVRPETAWLEGSGIELRDGVVCDQFLRTSAEGVWAAGDVCRWFNPLYDQEMRVEHWTSAVEHAMAIARVIVNPENMRPIASVPYVWSDQYDVSIQYIGHHGAGARPVLKHGSYESGQFVALFAEGDRFTAAVGFNMPRELNDYRRLLATRATLAEAMAHVVEDVE